VAPARVNRSLRAVLATALAAVLLASVAASPARADPTTPAQIEKEIASVWAKAEPLIEEYNGVHEQYKKNKAKQAELQMRLEPLQRQLDLAQLRIGAIAAQVYKGGQADAFNAVLSSGSPDMLADRLSYLDVMAREQQRQLTGVTTLKSEVDAQKAPIDRLVATLAQQDADLAKKRKDIEAKITQLQRLRRQAYGTTGAVGAVRPWPCPATYEPTRGYKVASFACKQAGKPYQWAADGPGSYDCSGLTSAAWKQVGVYLPHQSRAQRASIPYVSRSNLKLGDLIFGGSPIHHVAIYVGDGKVMHAPTFGDVVRMTTLDNIGSIHSYGRPG
jgi:peptidoglycan DL-endopeptidase CwlO